MTDIISFIIENTEWKLLETGRIKGSLSKRRKFILILTFEFRNKKKQFALGAMGVGTKNNACGYLLFKIFRENLTCEEITFESEIIHEQALVIPKLESEFFKHNKVGSNIF